MGHKNQVSCLEGIEFTFWARFVEFATKRGDNVGNVY